MPNLVIRKLADQDAEREKIFHPVTGDPILLEPEAAEQAVAALAEIMATVEPSPRPFLGIQVEGETPETTTVGERWVAAGRSEGWLEVEGEEVIYRTSGPPENPYGPPPHVFVHYTAIILKTVDGDVRYKVTENPDKWPEEKEGEAGFGGEVRWYYTLELVPEEPEGV